jgi:ferredoxin
VSVLLSVNVGLPNNVAWQGKAVYTGVWKHPADGPIMVRRLNIDGDGQGDTNGHGGEQRAVLVYQTGSYQVHTELFGALPSINPGLTGQDRRPPHPPSGSAGTGPLVTFARSGLSVPFPGDQRSVLELADACDVPTRWSCRTGVCHTCVTPLLSGRVAYAPDPLEPPAEGEVLICCARPGTDIVLDM